MRILVLADIHANWPALEAIDESFDACICLGDLVDYGVDPIPCLRWVRTHCRYVIRGNHDHAVAQRIVATGESGYRMLARATRPLMWQSLGAEELTYLARLPITLDLTLDGRHFHLVHATPRDPLDEVLLDDPVQWQRRLAANDASLVCVGHTHKQFAIKLPDGRQVINPGSVGQPRDGDPRAAYAIIENGRVELRRATYDIDRTVAMIEATTLSSDAKALAIQVLRTGGLVAPYGDAPPRPVVESSS